MKLKISLAGLVIMLALGSVYGLGVLHPADTIRLHDAKARVVGAGGELAVFLTIDNQGPADRLIAVQTDDAGDARIISPDPTVSIPAGSRPSLAADGAFIQLAGLDGDLDDGRVIALNLEFEVAGVIAVRARVDAPLHPVDEHLEGLFGIGGICRVGEGEPAPAISLELERDGDGHIVRILANAFEFNEDLVGGPHVPGVGHGHIYLNGLKLQRVYEPTIRIGALPEGEHEIRVTLYTNDHRAYVVDDVPVTAHQRVAVSRS